MIFEQMVPYGEIIEHKKFCCKFVVQSFDVVQQNGLPAEPSKKKTHLTWKRNTSRSGVSWTNPVFIQFPIYFSR